MTARGDIELRAERLSAYLDGEMAPEQRAAFEAGLAQDGALAADLARLVAQDAALRAGFDAMLDERIPAGLLAAIETAPSGETKEQEAANLTHRPRYALPLAAGLMLFALGLGGGAGLTRALAPPVVAAGWLDQVAEYHAVYSKQSRHLVEVAASEADHIEKWLGNETGVAFQIPDLTEAGLTFQGARLLVADGQPVAQLLYTDASGAVIGVCFMRLETAQEAAPVISARSLGAFDARVWKGDGAGYVVIAPQGRGDLDAIAQAAAKGLAL